MDWLKGYVEVKDKQRATSGSYAQELGQIYLNNGVEVDLDYMINNNMTPAQTPEITEEELIQDENWIEASKQMYEAFKPAEIDQTEIAPEDIGMEQFVTKAPSTDQEFAQWGIEFTGQLEYNLTNLGFKANAAENLSDLQKVSMGYMLEKYGSLPNFTWKGTKRFFKGIFTDPLTYASFGTFGIAELGRAGAKQLTKEGLKKALLRGLNPYAIAAYEGGGYTGAFDYFKQTAMVEAQKAMGDETAAVDPLQVGVSTAIGAGAAPVLGKGLELGVRGAAAQVPKITAGAEKILQGAISRQSERGKGFTLRSGIDPTEALDRAIIGAGKLLQRNESVPEIRAEGGLQTAPEKAQENLRQHTRRLQEVIEKNKLYPGGPKNPRTVIPAPKDSDLPDVVVGDITPDDWQQRIEATLSPEEINDFSSWYKKVFSEFERLSNGDPAEMAKLTDAWFAGQQNSSPTQTLNDVLFVYEQIKRGVPKEELRGKGLPSANQIVIDLLTGSEVTSGAGQKISDFLDSGYQKNVRSIMGNQPEGGSPFVVDIHTGRDTGLVDEIYLNHLRRLGYEVPEGLQIDFAGGISGPKYENRAIFGQQLTDHLNEQNWMGRSDWEPAEIQAIGWMQLSNMYGTENVGGDIVDAFARNTRRISMEVDPGAGSPWAVKFGDDYAALDADSKVQINNEVTAKAIELVNKRMGISLGQTVHGTGGWELYTNPSTVQQAIASKDTAIEAGAMLGYLLQQTEVWVNAPKAITKNPQNYAVDIVEVSGQKLRDTSSLGELFQRLIDEDPNGLFRGYQPIILDGKPGIRILITKDAVKESPLSMAKAQEYILDFANNKLNKITDDLQFDAEIDIMEADLTQLRNDWTKDQTGGGYKSYFSRQTGEDEGAGFGAVLDNDSRELEELFRTKIEQAKPGSKTEINSEPSVSDTGGSDGD